MRFPLVTSEYPDGLLLKSHDHSGEVHYHLDENRDYRILVTSTDNIGNESIEEVTGLHVDSNPPSVEEAVISGTNEETFYSSSYLIPCELSWTDTLTGIKSATAELRHEGTTVSVREYDFTEAEVPFEESGDIFEYAVVPEGSADPETTLDILWKLTDYAGNTAETWTEMDIPVVVDMENPVVTIDEGDIFTRMNGKRYLADSSLLFDLLAGIEEDNPDGDAVWTLSREEITVASGTLTAAVQGVTVDGEYSLTAEANDLAGNTGKSDEILFTLDTTAPEMNGELASFPEDRHPGEIVLVNFGAEEDNCIDHYRMEAGLIDTGGTELSSLVDGNVDGTLNLEGDLDEYRLELPEVPAGQYIIKIAAEDICGNLSDYKVLYNFQVSKPEDYLTVKDTVPVFQHGDRAIGRGRISRRSGGELLPVPGF